MQYEPSPLDIRFFDYLEKKCPEILEITKKAMESAFLRGVNYERHKHLETLKELRQK